MFHNRSLKLDLFALALLAVAVLLATSLFSYDPADPPSTLVHPPKAEVANSCGRVGAYVAHYLIASVGFGAFYVMTSLAAVGLMLLWRQEINQPVIRGVGWTASLAAASTIAAMALPLTTPGPEIGAGGYLGAMGFALLESHFAAVGAYIMALAVLMAGLLLCTDYMLLKAAAATTTVSGAGLMHVGRFGQRAVGRGRSSLESEGEDGELDEDEGEQCEDEYDQYDEYDEEEWDEEPGEDEPWEDDEEWEDEQEQFDDEEETEESPAPLTIRTPADKVEETSPDAAQDESAPTAGRGLREKISSALRIKNSKTKRSEREEVIDQLEAAEQEAVDDVDYQLPPLDLLLEQEDVSYEEHEKEVRRKAKVLERTFRNFGFNVKVVEIETGPVIAQYEIALEAGLRLSKITGLADDLAIALRVPSVRIVAPIPGKNTVGIEVPNESRQLVRLREVIEETNGRVKRMKIPIYLGKDVSGNAMAVDLAALPHLLIAGRTGTGKSVCLNSIIVSILMSRGPDEVRMLMIDPKMVELSGYKKLPHLMHPVVTDMRKAEAILAWAVDKMEERYQLLAKAGVRHVSVYNQLSEEELRDRLKPKSDAEWETAPKNLPFIVIVADEMADLMMTAGKEVEQHIIRLAQKSRAVGIHLILATQKPTVDVITGLIKSNLPARIAFQVASRTDSRVVLDENGADKLLGNGDMLFLSPGTSQLNRGQGTFLSDDEITNITEFVGTDSPQFARELIELKTKDEQEASSPAALKDRDELYEAAVDVVVREQRGSVSLLQRCLGIGYGRAARLIDYMAEDGIVAEYNGAKAREVLMSLADWEKAQGGGQESSDENAPLTAANVQPKPQRPNRIIPEVDEPSDLEDPPQLGPPPPRGGMGGGRRRSGHSDAHAPVAIAQDAATAVMAAPWESDETAASHAELSGAADVNDGVSGQIDEDFQALVADNRLSDRAQTAPALPDSGSIAAASESIEDVSEEEELQAEVLPTDAWGADDQLAANDGAADESAEAETLDDDEWTYEDDEEDQGEDDQASDDEQWEDEDLDDEGEEDDLEEQFESEEDEEEFDEDEGEEEDEEYEEEFVEDDDEFDEDGEAAEDDEQWEEDDDEWEDDEQLAVGEAEEEELDEDEEWDEEEDEYDEEEYDEADEEEWEEEDDEDQQEWEEEEVA